MPKDKERSVNPAQAQRKLEKQKALKKGKAELQARRNEKLARKNPFRLQRQIDDLKATEDSGRPLGTREKQHLEELQKELAAVKKAREALGDKAPTFGGGESRPRQQHDRSGGQGVLGKRRRDGSDWGQHDDSSDTDESVRGIPMPRDTPPPIPRQYHGKCRPGGEERDGERPAHGLPQKPPVTEAKAVYESAPVIRDLRKEAVSRFVPAVVRQKQEAAKGHGGLVEPEEMDRLEEAGYVAGGGKATAAPTGAAPAEASAADIDPSRLAEEEERFNREIRSVQIEEVSDEDL